MDEVESVVLVLECTGLGLEEEFRNSFTDGILGDVSAMSMSDAKEEVGWKKLI